MILAVVCAAVVFNILQPDGYYYVDLVEMHGEGDEFQMNMS
jgi:hypothetical protein